MPVIKMVLMIQTVGRVVDARCPTRLLRVARSPWRKWRPSNGHRRGCDVA